MTTSAENVNDERCWRCPRLLSFDNSTGYCFFCREELRRGVSPSDEALGQQSELYGFSPNEPRRFKERAQIGQVLNITFADNRYFIEVSEKGVIRGFLTDVPTPYLVPPDARRGINLQVISSAVSSQPFVGETRFHLKRPIVNMWARSSGTFVELVYPTA